MMNESIALPNNISFYYQVLALNVAPNTSDDQIEQVISKLPSKFDDGPWTLAGYYRFPATNTIAVFLVKADIPKLPLAA